MASSTSTTASTPPTDSTDLGADDPADSSSAARRLILRLIQLSSGSALSARFAFHAGVPARLTFQLCTATSASIARKADGVGDAGA